ncbi:hypothetical protein F5B22DRAFT_254720 [Xylaria bambusicola]|uniref:uncharacterized protein n=1 Tax=Xylaria bambusicola TaxID=326684 RepID=UPI00200864D6|nr:uncharacterized protein F5B22DRAFT_254720 [Xylaria bambusicola]KAI0525802.1 hypothetical protein F5B22DRAFT_254720 [Xylaria bambusicola]
MGYSPLPTLRITLPTYRHPQTYRGIRTKQRKITSERSLACVYDALYSIRRAYWLTAEPPWSKYPALTASRVLTDQSASFHTRRDDASFIRRNTASRLSALFLLWQAITVQTSRPRGCTMRLLQRDNAGNYSLTPDLTPDQIPPYAILSHIWGPDEVVFTDIANP